MSTNHGGALGALKALLKDCLELLPELRDQLYADFDNLQKRTDARGVRVVMIDLPKLGRLFDKGLSTGFIQKKDIPESLGSWNKGFIFKSLVLQSFTEAGVLHEPDPDIVLFTRAILYLYKKVELDCSADVYLASVRKFLEIEADLRQPDASWDTDNLQWFSETAELCRGFVPGKHHDEARGTDLPRGSERTLNQLLGTLDIVCRYTTPNKEVDWCQILPKHGPGAVSDLPRLSDKYSMTWNSRLETVFPSSYYLSLDGVNPELMPDIQKEPPKARLIAVPKELSGPRLIASEPTANQFIQQGLMRWLRSNLSRPLQNCINFTSQHPNRSAAKQASLDGEAVTVDLSSASDRLSCWVVERAFSSNASLLHALWAVRSGIVDLRTIQKKISGLFGGHIKGSSLGLPDEVPLKKYACQGSAVTFPVQSIIYAQVAIACVLYNDGKIKPSARDILRASGKVRVFGDDIIVPKGALLYLGLVFEHLQLKINASKTHHSGHFRESCGLDGYKGYEVTPIYLTSFELGSKPQQLQSWIDVSNNAYRAGFWNLTNWMDKQLPKKELPNIYIGRQQTAGLRLECYSGQLLPRRERWNFHLQRKEYRMKVLVAKETRVSRGTERDVLQYFLEAPSDPEIKWGHGYVQKTRALYRYEWVAIDD
nr:MAG: hypothetical protein 3 [Leviviridae sp.]